MRKKVIISSVLFLALVLTLLTLTNTSVALVAPSNESQLAITNLESAQNCLSEMQTREIPIQRVDASLQEATQIYSAQIALENLGKKADYTTVNNLASQVCEINKIAIEAQDQLQIFVEAYREASLSTNLSEMEAEYQDTLRSFDEERFEDTIQLVNQGYLTLSEIQASQTAARLFAETVGRGIKNFLRNNWVWLSVATVVVILLLIIFWKTLRRARYRLKLYKLSNQKSALYGLIKKLQAGYFTNKTISETEFNVKLTRFKEMIRDIDRQIPMIKEQILRIERGSSLRATSSAPVKSKYASSSVEVREKPRRRSRKAHRKTRTNRAKSAKKKR